MFYRRGFVFVFLAVIMLDMVSADSTYAQILCSDVKYGNPKYHDKMDELAERAGLPDNYWSRHHEDVVRSFCTGEIKDIDKLITDGFVKPKEVQGIAKALGKNYKPKQRSEAGKSYAYSRKKFSDMGACSACADNIAQYYTTKPDSPCGKLAKQALEGNSDAIKILMEFPDYCKWKH